jgi:hypothetical protein
MPSKGEDYEAKTAQIVYEEDEPNDLGSINESDGSSSDEMYDDSKN